MKVTLTALFMFAISACQGPIINGNNPQASPTPSPTPTPRNMPVPGAYVSQNPSDPAMQTVFREAERLLQARYPEADLRLTQLRSISSQVVAGANYRLDADYTDKKGKGEVTLYAGQRKLTLSWRDLQAYGGQRASRGNVLPRGFQRVDRVEVA